MLENHTNPVRYKQVAAEIAKRIVDGEWASGVRLPSESVLSKQYNVSRVTIRGALNLLQRNHDIVSRGRKGRFVKRIRKKKVETDSDIVSLILPIPSAQWELSEIVQRVSEIFENSGTLVSVHCSLSDWKRERRFIDEAHRRHSAGVLLYSVDDTENSDLLHRLHVAGYPIVLLDSPSSFVNLSSVSSDNRQGGIIQAAAVLDDEVTDAFYLISCTNASHALSSRVSIRERYFAFLDELYRKRTDHIEYDDIDLDNHLLRVERSVLDATKSGRQMPKTKVRWVEEWLDQIKFPIGVGCLNDGVARWLMEYLSWRNVRVPEDVRIVGFDNAAAHVSGKVALSSVQQDFRHMGAIAADMLIRQINGEHIEVDNVSLPVEFVGRESTIAVFPPELKRKS